MKYISIITFIIVLSNISLGADYCTNLYAPPVKESDKLKIEIKKIFSSRKVKLFNLVPGLNYRDLEVEKVVDKYLEDYFSVATIKHLKKNKKSLLKYNKELRTEILDLYRNELIQDFRSVSIHINGIKEMDFKKVNSEEELFNKMYSIFPKTETIYKLKRDLLSISYILDDSVSLLKAIDISLNIDSKVQDFFESPYGQSG